jgi:hypothetical protein
MAVCKLDTFHNNLASNFKRYVCIHTIIQQFYQEAYKLEKFFHVVIVKYVPEMLIAALFVTAKKWKQHKCPSTTDMNK